MELPPTSSFQGLPLHLVNGIDCEKYLRNSGGLRCWLRLFSEQLCNYAVKCRLSGIHTGGSPEISPNLPPIIEVQKPHTNANNKIKESEP